MVSKKKVYALEELIENTQYQATLLIIDILLVVVFTILLDQFRQGLDYKEEVLKKKELY